MEHEYYNLASGSDKARSLSMKIAKFVTNNNIDIWVDQIVSSVCLRDKGKSATDYATVYAMLALAGVTLKEEEE